MMRISYLKPILQNEPGQTYIPAETLAAVQDSFEQTSSRGLKTGTWADVYKNASLPAGVPVAMGIGHSITACKVAIQLYSLYGDYLQKKKTNGECADVILNKVIKEIPHIKDYKSLADVAAILSMFNNKYGAKKHNCEPIKKAQKAVGDTLKKMDVPDAEFKKVLDDAVQKASSEFSPFEDEIAARTQEARTRSFAAQSEQNKMTGDREEKNSKLDKDNANLEKVVADKGRQHKENQESLKTVQETISETAERIQQTMNSSRLASVSGERWLVLYTKCSACNADVRAIADEMGVDFDVLQDLVQKYPGQRLQGAIGRNDSKLWRN